MLDAPNSVAMREGGESQAFPIRKPWFVDGGSALVLPQLCPRYHK